MPYFDRRGAAVRARLDAREILLLRGLAREMRTLLEADVPRADPVVARLFPDAYDDERERASYRELVDGDLRAAKLRALTTVERGLEEPGGVVTLDDRDAEAWLTFANDVRLAIGTRLGVDEDAMAAEVSPDDPDADAFAVMHWLAWVQESLLDVIGSPDGDDRGR